MEQTKKVGKSWSFLNFIKKKEKHQDTESKPNLDTKLKKKQFLSAFDLRDKFRKSKKDIQAPNAVIQITPPTPQYGLVLDTDIPKVQTPEPQTAPIELQSPPPAKQTEDIEIDTAEQKDTTEKIDTAEKKDVPERKETVERKDTQTEEKPSRLGSIGRALTTNIPFVSWFKTSNAIQDNINPILHLATVSMNMSELKDNKESVSTVHQLLAPSGKGAYPGLWDDIDDTSSIESYDSNYERVASSENQSTDKLNDDATTPVGQLKKEYSVSSIALKPEVELSIEEKLQIVFELPERETYVDEFACWMMRSVPLKGYMYVTQSHICFYSSLPSMPGELCKSGYLQKLSHGTVRNTYSTKWFVLKSHGLYIYPDATKLYNPTSTIYLKSVVEVRQSSTATNVIKLKTTDKEYRFKADTEVQLKEWLEAFETAIFNAKNSGNDVKVVFPFTSLASVSIAKTSFGNDSLKITVVCEESITTDDYLFSYFNDVQKCYVMLNLLWQQSKDMQHTIRKKTSGRLLHRKDTDGQPKERPKSQLSISSTSLQRTTSIPKISVSSDPVITITPTKSAQAASGDDKLNYSPPADSPLAIVDLPPRSDKPPSMKVVTNEHRKSNSFAAPMSVPILSRSPPELKYDGGFKVDEDKRRSWWSSHRKTSSDGGEIYNEKAIADDQKNSQFVSLFAVPETEKLVQTFSVYYISLIPYIGKLYISSNYVCFKSRLVGARAKVVLPLNEVVSVEKLKRFTPLDSIVLKTKSRDEILFDFHTTESRNECLKILSDLMKHAKTQKVDLNSPAADSLLEVLPRKDEHVKSSLSDEDITNLQPFVTPKPPVPEKMHITCLTIGTRGDVQPYIALCKGFMGDGHTCRIATHDEYREWIEGFGIEFSSVKGDPAELMQLCVDYGGITVGFIREALNKFTGWIDELLDSCYDACQGTDLLIESPTAFGGLHVSEKLQIPFFSAFPMPWTRTRAYPHPFAVPDKHMGGTYNYMSHAMIEQVLWKGIVGQVNTWRKNKLDLVPLPYALENKKIPFLYSFSPSVVPQPADWPDWIHTCGYWFLDNPEHNWNPPESLTEFLNSGPPPVYIGFGSIIVQDPVVKSGVRAILSKGWSARGQTGPAAAIEYPPSIYPLDRVPHDWLFPKCAGVVHHGGAGTTAAGLRAGRPTVVKPFFGDQFFWGDRIHDLGIGACLRKFTVDTFASALTSITTDETMREKAAEIGNNIQKENGVRAAIDYVYRDLEFSKKRIHDLAAIHKMKQK
ncbi:Sterol 3-beta-glucosyltransferase [Terramyces sp. JEL0728]|nr:Sterol 3-beta-glucosyltransferase [Terramyces sp. JEL0728]